jgi:hypothetical protein
MAYLHWKLLVAPELHSSTWGCIRLKLDWTSQTFLRNCLRVYSILIWAWVAIIWGRSSPVGAWCIPKLRYESFTCPANDFKVAQSRTHIGKSIIPQDHNMMRHRVIRQWFEHGCHQQEPSECVCAFWGILQPRTGFTTPNDGNLG